MKKVKYTNTGVKSLKIERTGRKAVIYDETYPEYKITLTTIRNHSKYERARTQVEYSDLSYIIEMNKDNLIAYISNYFLFVILFIDERYDLILKLFSESTLLSDFDLIGYISMMAERRYK